MHAAKKSFPVGLACILLQQGGSGHKFRGTVLQILDTVFFESNFREPFDDPGCFDLSWDLLEGETIPKIEDELTGSRFFLEWDYKQGSQAAGKHLLQTGRSSDDHAI